MQKLVKLHKELCGELGIHPARLYFDEEIDSLGQYNPLEQAIRINIPKNRQGKYSLEYTMAHETYHHYQCVRGWLTPATWKGKDKELLIYLFAWHQRPWEIGAVRYSNKQAKKRGWL